MKLPAYATLLLMLVLMLVPAESAQAQEVQVAFDEEGTVQVIDAELEERLQLFSEYSNFQEARLFRVAPERYELVVQYLQDGEVVRTRQELSADELQELRRRVSERLAEVRIDRVQVEDGRRKFLTVTTLLGSIQGGLIPAAFGTDDERIIGSFPLFGAAAGFGIPFFMTRGRLVTETEATMTAYGGFQGLSHGVLLSLLFGGENASAQGAAAVTSLMSAGQAVAGFRAASRPGLTAGMAEGLALGSLYGHGYGLGVYALFLDDIDDASARGLAGSMLLGSVAGSYGGYELARRADYTQGDVRINSMAGLLGLQTASTALLLADAGTGRGSAAVSMLGTSAGLMTGWRLVRQRDFTRSQANIISLGTFAGAALGGAFNALLDADEETAAVLSLLGSGAGFGVTYWVYADEARAAYGQSLQLNVNPVGLYNSMRGGQDTMIPAVQMRYTF